MVKIKKFLFTKICFRYASTVNTNLRLTRKRWVCKNTPKDKNSSDIVRSLKAHKKSWGSYLKLAVFSYLIFEELKISKTWYKR